MEKHQSVVIYPSISSVAEGFPDVTGCSMQEHVTSDNFSGIIKSINLVFSKMSPDKTHIIDTHIYLLNSKFGRAKIEFEKHFPRFISCRIEDTEDKHTKKPMKALHIEFVIGSLSFVFEKAFHAISSYKVR